LKDRVHLLQHNLRSVHEAASAFVAKGNELADAVVILTDGSDAFGKGFAIAMMGEAKWQEFVQRNLAVGLNPTLYAAIPRDAAYERLHKNNPRIAASLQDPIPPGSVRVVVIASGGTTYTVVPMEVARGAVAPSGNPSSCTPA